MIPDRSIKTKALQLTNNTVPSRHRLQLQGRRREENGKSPHPRVASSARRLAATATIPHRWLLPGRHRCSPASACSFSGGQSGAAVGRLGGRGGQLISRGPGGWLGRVFDRLARAHLASVWPEPVPARLAAA